MMVKNCCNSAQTNRNKFVNDRFTDKDGTLFAGLHILADFWGAKNLTDPDHIEQAIRETIKTCGATLLNIHLHHFGSTKGVSGVALLAESHISVHTWPERNFAAFDIFMCGTCNPEYALPVLKKFFIPEDIRISFHRRGRVE